MHNYLKEDLQKLERIVDEIPELKYAGDPIIRKICQRVVLNDFGNGTVERTFNKLKSVLNRFNKITGGGVGIAANQIGISKKIIVLRPKLDDEFIMMINPRIVKSSEERIVYPEMCMSLGVIFTGEIIRSQQVEVEYYDSLNKKKRDTFEDKMAIILQHEIGHLNGELCTDYASPKSLKIGSLREEKKIKYLKNK